MTDWKEGEELRHIASIIDSKLNFDCRYRPKDEPFSDDPVVWAKAFLASGDWIYPVQTMRWFENAMSVRGDGIEYDEIYPWD